VILLKGFIVLLFGMAMWYATAGAKATDNLAMDASATKATGAFMAGLILVFWAL